jgi:NAD(P)-dependent dehydrogenase (short-subunit alcohol dehydrogenase family)
MEGKSNMDILQDKVALITGGASGIGRASAVLLAGEGAAVSIVDINEEMGQSVVAEIAAVGRRAIFISCDVTKSEDCRQAVENTVAAFGGLDILFNNAGIIRRADVVTTTEAEWDRVMDVNVKSIFLMSKYSIPHIEKRGGGTIINTSSGWGLKGGENAVSYCASKGAVTNMTRAMAMESKTFALMQSAPVTPTPQCCTMKQGNWAGRKTSSWPRRPPVRWDAMPGRTKLLRLCYSSPVGRPVMSLAQR